MKVQIEPETLHDAMGLVLRALRKERGEGQQALADRIGCSHSRLSRLETGHQFWTIVDLWMIAEAYDVPPADLLERAAARLKSAPAQP